MIETSCEDDLSKTLGGYSPASLLQSGSLRSEVSIDCQASFVDRNIYCHKQVYPKFVSDDSEGSTPLKGIFLLQPKDNAP